MKKLATMNYIRHVIYLNHVRNKMEQYAHKNHKLFKKYLEKYFKHNKAIVDILEKNGEEYIAKKLRSNNEFLFSISTEFFKTNKNI